MLELKVDAATGVPYVMEVNGRFWGSLQLAVDAGVDFPVLLVRRALGLPTQGLVLSLLGFNVGVELGQALVVAVALPALALLRRTRWEPRVVRIASLATLLVGAALFLERALL